MQNQLIYLLLPWFDPAGELNYSAMTLHGDKVCTRKAHRIMRKWYKASIGITVDKSTLQRIWKRRFETTAMNQDKVNEIINNMARSGHEEIETEGDTRLQT